jgi:hypothetical protein
MNLNITYDQNTLNSAPAAFFSAVNYVVSAFDANFTNNVTVNIKIGYGNFPYDNSPVPALGESEQNGLAWGNYSQVRQALISEGAPGSNTLPSTSPLGGSLVLDSAQEKALGLIGPSSALDGWVGIASDATLSQIGGSWSYGPTAIPGANQYYLVGVLEHEISEVMGRTSYLDVRGEYGVMDLYRYRSPGVHQTGTGSPAYFSTDGGTTNLDNWNTQPSGDIGDWANSAGADAFLAFSSPGQINGLTSADFTLLRALGWTAATTPSVSVQAPNNLVLFSASDSGVKGDNVTDINTPLIFGLGAAGDTVTLYDSGATIGTGTVGSSGVWSISPSKLSPGVHALAAIQTDHLGNVSSKSAALNLTIVAPQPDEFDGNNTSDILFQDASSGHVNQFNMQNGQSSWQYIGWAPSGSQIVGTGDFNGDGTSDILLQDPTSGNLSQFKMQSGQATWQNVSPVSTDWKVVGTGDFNGDGTSDILLEIPATGLLGDYQMHNGQATWQNISSVSPVWQVEGTGDFNADGTTDILFEIPATGALAEFEMHNGQATAKGLGSVPAGYTVAGVGDFHGNGYGDILLRNSTTGDVAELRADNGMTFADIGWASPSWQIAGTGDYNGDGTTDILFRDPSSNFLSQFQMSDGHASSSLIGWAPANWTIHS